MIVAVVEVSSVSQEEPSKEERETVTAVLREPGSGWSPSVG